MELGSIPEGHSESLGSLDDERAHARYTSTRRAFRIIDRVSRGGGRLTVKGLAHDLGIGLSTCYHLVGILMEEGYVERLPHHAGYRLGPMAAVLYERSRGVGEDSVIDGVLADLSQRSGCGAYFAVLYEDDDVLVTHTHSPPQQSPVGVTKGFRGPSHALALGKALIAAGGVRAINRYVEDKPLEAFTTRTITNRVRLEAHLKEVRAHGFATDFEEFARNMCCVAAAVEGEDHVLGAVGLATTPRSSVEDIKALIALAREGAERISSSH